MIRKIGIVLIFFLFTGQPAGAAGRDLSGNWNSSVWGHTVLAEVKQTGEKISGVAYLYGLLGEVNIYHFNGTLDKDKLTASHYSGHMFAGQFLPDGRLKGILTTKNGRRFSVCISPSTSGSPPLPE
ncbi:MAG: hypothetical protein L3J03_10885 [Desulfobacterales bacterium]|nr:hypothetical protein [Desulfobacterales bacterium]